MIKNKKFSFKGYCCNFLVDKNNDKFLKNSFIFQERIPILYEHKMFIGYTKKILEDCRGLYIEFELFEHMSKFILKIPRNLSIGFRNFFSEKPCSIYHLFLLITYLMNYK